MAMSPGVAISTALLSKLLLLLFTKVPSRGPKISPLLSNVNSTVAGAAMMVVVIEDSAVLISAGASRGKFDFVTVTEI